MKELVTVIEDFEKTSLPNLSRNALAHRVRANIKVKNQELISEKVFQRKVDKAKRLRDRIQARYTEIKDFVRIHLIYDTGGYLTDDFQRDALVSASGVLESRAAVSQVPNPLIVLAVSNLLIPYFWLRPKACISLLCL